MNLAQIAKVNMSRMMKMMRSRGRGVISYVWIIFKRLPLLLNTFLFVQHTQAKFTDNNLFSLFFPCSSFFPFLWGRL